MGKANIIRAWKDQACRDTLSESERAALPMNPADDIMLNDEDMVAMKGGSDGHLSPLLGGTALCTPCGQIQCY